MHHVDGDVPLLAVTPALPHSRGFLNHGAGILRDTLAMESGLGYLPLRAVPRAFRRDHAFAQ